MKFKELYPTYEFFINEINIPDEQFNRKIYNHIILTIKRDYIYDNLETSNFILSNDWAENIEKIKEYVEKTWKGVDTKSNKTKETETGKVFKTIQISGGDENTYPNLKQTREAETEIFDWDESTKIKIMLNSTSLFSTATDEVFKHYFSDFLFDEEEL